MPGGALLLASPAPASLCRVDAAVGRTAVPGIYTVYVAVKPDCPPGGSARVRVQGGQVYPWRTVTPERGTAFRGIPWWYTGAWQAASGKPWPLAFTLPPPWRRP